MATARPHREPVDFSVLGPLRVEGRSGAIEIRGAKERLLLARLVAAGGRLVPASDLIDTLWGDEPPASAAKSLQTFVARLRNALEPDRHGSPTLLITEGPGYRLALDPTQVDAERFARLARMGERSLADGRAEQAATTLTEALSLWRGPAYAGFEGAGFAVDEARRLHELRTSATEDRLGCELALGRTGEAVPELERLVGEFPMRERLWEMLVTALYRAGRQGDALAAYERARAVLDDELGVDPGPGLKSVHARVLAHDPSLGLPTHTGGALPPQLRPNGILVGRDVELARLRSAWQHAVLGRPATVVVRGPVGAGASALAAAFAAEAAREGAEVRYAAGMTGPMRPPAARPTPSPAPSLLVLDHPNSADPSGATPDRLPSPTLTLRLVGHLAQVPAGAEVLDLIPLSAMAVREIVAEHVGHGDVDDTTAEVLARSGGWPGAVHAAAADIARTRALHLVEAAVAATGASSVDLAVARADLADGVASLTVPRTLEPAPDPTICPWRGLAAYDVDDARWYAGRERLVAEVVSRMPGTRLLALVGASGSGKSSLLRAGLLAALRRDLLPGSAAWRVVTLRPGAHPLRELTRRALGRPDGDGAADTLLRALVDGDPDTDERVVVAVDQLEEAWTLCHDDAERRQFLDALADLATDPRSPVTVVVALRADYLSELADHPDLRTLVGDGTVLVGPLTPAEIRRAVERPAATARLTLDDGLADTIVSDAGQEPGLLPLLSTALTQLWEHRDDGHLTYPAYVGLGGLNGAIATLAEEAYAALTPPQQGAARTLLLRLTGPGDGAAATRRRVPVGELAALPTPGITTVVEHLARARLLTVADGTVEVAHEALFREWPRLRSWLVEDAAGRAVQRRLAVAAAEWDAEGREDSTLWTGTRLASGLEVAEARPEEVTSTEQEFLSASRDAVDAQQRAVEERAATTARQNRRLRILVGGIGVVLVAALAAGATAWRSQQAAETAASAAEAASLSAEAKRLAASALNIEYPDLALLAAVESTKLEQSPETYGAMLTLLARQPQVVHRLRDDSRFLDVAASPDGRTVYLIENKPRIRAVDAESGRIMWNRDMPNGGPVGGITPTPDGTGVIVTEQTDNIDLQGIVRLDAATGEVLWETRTPDLQKIAPGPWRFVMNGDLTTDGRYLVTTDTHVFALDPTTGAVAATAAAWPEQFGYTTEFVVWPNGRVSRNKEEDPSTGLAFDPTRPAAGTVEIEGVPRSFSRDGSRLVLTREIDGAMDLRVARVDDLSDTSPWVRMPAYVARASWSPDGRSIVVTSEDGIQLFDPDTAQLGVKATGHSGAVNAAQFTGAQADLVWTAGRDGTAVAFDLSGSRTPIATRPAELDPYTGRSATAAGLGVFLRSPEDDANTAHVADLATGQHLGELAYDLGDTSAIAAAETEDVLPQVSSVAITPDGETALVGIEFIVRGPKAFAEAGYVAVFDVASRTQRALVRTPWAAIGLAMAPDGRRAVINGEDGAALLDVASAEIVGTPVELERMAGMDWTTSAEVSPDGRLAALARNGEVVLVDVSTGRVVRRGQVAEAEDQLIQAIAWSGDSTKVVAGSSGGWLHFVSAATLEPVAPGRLITGGWVTDLETSPDGRIVASIGSDGDVTLWDTATWRPFGQPLTDDRDWGWLTFTPDGYGLRVFFRDQQVVDVSTTPKDWVAAACAAAGRNLTAAESAVILPGQTPSATCPDAA